MKKVYKIYEPVDTNLEKETVSYDYGSTFTKYPFLLRTIFREDYFLQNELLDGFRTLEGAEKFIEQNIGEYENWIVVTEYKKQ